MLTKSQVKYIQSLNEKKFRQENGLFVAEGPKIISELLSGDGAEPVALYATGEWWMKNPACRKIPFVQFYELTQAELERISFLTTPHEVLGVFKQPTTKPPVIAGSVWLVLDGIQDPGNFGTIMRIADWFGVEQIIAGRDSVDVYNPKVVQSSMGSIARVNVHYEDIALFLGQHPGVPVYASTLHGQPLSTFGKLKNGMLLIGNESRGIKDELLKLASHQLTIPKVGNAESLNAAVATGIILSHIVEL